MTVSDSSSQGAGSGLITGQLSVATQYTTDNVPAIAMNWNSLIDKVNIEYLSALVNMFHQFIELLLDSVVIRDKFR